ncbi:MAG: heavy-metal-associated domain-containing protein [Sphingobacteriaceae bacterium]|nr:heavy-metal-associated domain-containing protein [Sphingobacteriaceae bacterium]
MKKLILIALIFTGLKIKSQVITSTLSVKGNCDDCKKRIENAADIKGVKDFIWDKKTKIATVTYSSDKTSLIEIEEAIAKSGYDTENAKGHDKAYNKLPKCCKYRTEKCEKD